MSVNQHRPHVLVLPEDDANRQIANGFLLDYSLDARAIQVLPNAGGWIKVREAFEKTHRAEMNKHANRYMVLLVDFDLQEDRRKEINKVIPDSLAERVFVLGTWSHPEALKKTLGPSLENIGKAVARDCREKSDNTWNHALLMHNKEELNRMTPILRPILFPSD